MFGQEADTLDLTPSRAYVNTSEDTCFCWCGPALNRITEYKISSEGCTISLIASGEALANAKNLIGLQENENKSLRASNLTKDIQIEYLTEEVAREKIKTKRVGGVGLILTFMVIIL